MYEHRTSELFLGRAASPPSSLSSSFGVSYFRATERHTLLSITALVIMVKHNVQLVGGGNPCLLAFLLRYPRLAISCRHAELLFLPLEAVRPRRPDRSIVDIVVKVTRVAPTTAT